MEGEEEVGQLGHEQTIILASEQDSTMAKATSAVHVPHEDTKKMVHQEVNVEEYWSDDDIKITDQLGKNVTTNADAPQKPLKKEGEEGESEEGEEASETKDEGSEQDEE